MNRAYRLIWSDINRTWVAVSDIVKARGKRTGGSVVSNHLSGTGCFILKTLASTLLMAGMAHAAPPVNALPTGGTVSAGQATLQQTGNTLNINQSTAKAVLNWNTFNVGRDATVNFNQPSASSVTLNRVTGGNPSQIFGHINANGQVFLSNGSGIYFAPSASVNVGAFTATTHSITDDDFMAGRYLFNRNGATGSVINDGNISTNDINGYIALLAPEVRNNGVIIAQLGTVALAAGEAFELQFDGNNLLNNIRVEASTLQALVENGNAVHAPEGLIILSAQAVNSLQGGGIINNTGTLEASGFTNNGGVVRLSASDSISHTGSINVDAAKNSTGNGGTATLIASLDNPNSITQMNGSISAKGGDLGGHGGFVETSGTRLKISDSASVGTAAKMGLSGTWLIDPMDFTIAASGGDVTGAAITAGLAHGNVSIEALLQVWCDGVVCGSGTAGNGDIFVNDTISWSGNNLTLFAWRNININAVMTASDTSQLDLIPVNGKVNVGFNADGTFKGRVDFPNRSGKFLVDGTTPILTINNNTYTIINSLGAEGSVTKADLQGIAGDLSARYALGANIDATVTAGWNTNHGFAPIGSDSSKFTGTFDGLGHTISNLVTDNSAGGIDIAVGLFAVTSSTSLIRNLGLINPTVRGFDHSVGGLVGDNSGEVSHTFVEGATGSITAGSTMGGLVGINRGTIEDSYAAIKVTGSNRVGGLVGNNQSIIMRSYSNSPVYAYTGQDLIGGLVGQNEGGTISNSYATGNVASLNSSVGGLVGGNGGTVTNSYATGSVSGDANLGGLIGTNGGTVTNSFWNTQTSGQATSSGGTGMTSIDMQTQVNFTSATSANGNVNPAWDLTTPLWKMESGKNNGYPYLAWQTFNLPIYLRLNTGGSSYYGDTSNFTYALYDSISGGAVVSNASPIGTVSWSAPLSATSAANTYAETYVSGLTVDSSLYTLQAGSAVGWTVNARPLTITAGSTSRVYGSADPVKAFTAPTGTNGSGSGLVNGDSISSVTNTIAGTAIATANAGTTHAITSSDPVFGSGSAGNYAITYANGTLTIAKAHLTVTANNQTRYYGEDNQPLTETITGYVNGEDATSASVSGSASGSTSADAKTGAGSPTINGSIGTLSAANYDFTAANGTLTIAKAHLTVTANNQTRYISEDNPPLTETITGYVNGETLSTSGVKGTATGLSAATRETLADKTDIVASADGLSADNYDFTKLVNGTLKIKNIEPPPSSSLTGVSSLLPGLNTTSSLLVNFIVKLFLESGADPSELKLAGFSASNLKSAGYSASNLKSAGYSAIELLEAGGYDLSDLLEAGYDLSDLKSASFSWFEFKKAGYYPADLKSAGFSASDLKSAGYHPADLKSAGFSVRDLKSDGFSASELKLAGFSVSDLKSAGFSARDLISAGYSMNDLMLAGYSLTYIDTILRLKDMPTNTITNSPKAYLPKELITDNPIIIKDLPDYIISNSLDEVAQMYPLK